MIFSVRRVSVRCRESDSIGYRERERGIACSGVQVAWQFAALGTSGLEVSGSAGLVYAELVVVAAWFFS